MRNRLEAIAHRLGHAIRRLATKNQAVRFRIHSYCNPNGSFDYEKYKATQIAGNKRKLDKVWVAKENIAFLADYIGRRLGHATFGLCHGTRRGKEQAWFRELLHCEVLGTEISDTAEQFPNTIQWDFHEIKPEWIHAADFIYSNSFDHSYDPEKCLKAWMRCLKKGGMCIIEHTSDHETSSELDPFGASIAVMPYLILKWGEGGFCVRELLDAPFKPRTLSYMQYLIIQNL